MKALIYAGPCDVRVKEVPDAKIQDPTDVLVRITSTNICGSDLHMLADILPTGYHATELAELKPGESLVIYGAGPVGLMAVYSAAIKGAREVFIVDRLPDRLALAEKLGAIPIDDSEGSPVEQILDLTDGLGADKGCECVGYHGTDPKGDEHANLTMNNLIDSVRATGAIGVVGVFAEEDPKAPDKLAKKGQLPINWGKFWTKGLRVGTGQANVKAYNRQLCHLIEHGKVNPSLIVSHELPLEEAPDAYKHFDARDPGWTKVVLKPAGQKERLKPVSRRAHRHAHAH